MSDELAMMLGIGKKCRRCDQLFKGVNVVCGDCQEEIEEVDGGEEGKT